jgi:hypothetical protein
MPGINDGEAVLRPLVEQARDAGAYDVLAGPCDLRLATRTRLLPRLGRRDLLGKRDGDRLLATFRRIRLEHGFPRPVPGRG